MAKAEVISREVLESQSSSGSTPFFTEQVAAGFPSPADDYLEDNLDLNEFLVKHPVATFFVRVTGDSMIGAGIHSGDILIVDRALEATNKRVIIAVVNGEMTVKRLVRKNGKIYLAPENDKYQAIEIKEETDLEVWGVVTTVLHGLL